MNRVAVVIPVYRINPTETERISLIQAISILGAHPIIVVAPESLELSQYYELGVKKVKTLPDECFQSIETYSRLCMSRMFYEIFFDYEYILIYQLDAFVFSDRLFEFCEKGYDYIGAPVPKGCWEGVPFYVGNGGFSLRNVKKCIEVVEEKDDILRRFKDEFGGDLAESLKTREDCFFGYCGYLDEVDYTVPDLDTAFDFSVEFNLNGIYSQIESHLPFGCHRWQTYRFDTWWSIISSYGYAISDDVYDASSRVYQWHEYRVLMDILKNRARSMEIGNIVKGIIGSERLSIWGYGNEGRVIAENLKEAGLEIIQIFDKKSGETGVTVPNDDLLSEVFVPLIVTTSKYETEVVVELTKAGLKRGLDFYTWRELVVSICQELGVYEIGEVIG